MPSTQQHLVVYATKSTCCHQKVTNSKGKRGGSLRHIPKSTGISWHTSQVDFKVSSYFVRYFSFSMHVRVRRASSKIRPWDHCLRIFFYTRTGSWKQNTFAMPSPSLPRLQITYFLTVRCWCSPKTILPRKGNTPLWSLASTSYAIITVSLVTVAWHTEPILHFSDEPIPRTTN